MKESTLGKNHSAATMVSTIMTVQRMVSQTNGHWVSGDCLTSSIGKHYFITSIQAICLEIEHRNGYARKKD